LCDCAEPDCEQALSCYNAVAAGVAKYMEERDSKETKLDLGLMRISLSEVDGILGETHDEDEAALEFDRLNAQGGDLWAQKELGWRSLVGKGVEEDMGNAHAHLEAAVAGGDPEAMHNLGYMHMNGLGVEQNYTKAKEYFDKAADGNITAAFNALGYMHMQGVGTAKNLSEAERMLKRAADLDDPDGAFNLASLYQETDKNMTRAYPLLEQASEVGFWRAHLAVAEANEFGIGRSRNCTAAVVALKKLAETWGGVAHELRDGVELYKQGNFAEARQLFCELAEQGVEVAQSNCAWLTLKGKGIQSPVNETRRFLAIRRMFALGGQQGGADSHLRLGDMEWYGQGREPNRTAAVEHYKLAASRRSHQASFIMGTLYHFGIVVERNLTLARRMYRKTGSSDFTNVPSHLCLSLLTVQVWIETLMNPVIPHMEPIIRILGLQEVRAYFHMPFYTRMIDDSWFVIDDS
jgi:SEL1 protein